MSVTLARVRRDRRRDLAPPQLGRMKRQGSGSRALLSDMWCRLACAPPRPRCFSGPPPWWMMTHALTDACQGGGRAAMHARTRALMHRFVSIARHVCASDGKGKGLLAPASWPI